MITKLSELLVSGEIGKASTIYIDAEGDKVLKYKVVKEECTEPRTSRRRRRGDRGETRKTKKTKRKEAAVAA